MRINLYGGPGSGKSTTAAWLFAKLKLAGCSVEHVGEYVKSWAYARREVKEFDQIYLLGKQMQYEYRFLTHGVQHIVTDSPVFNNYYYAPEPIRGHILSIVNLYEMRYPGLNIFLDRKDKPYVQEGRYQTEGQAKQVDVNMMYELKNLGRAPQVFAYNNLEGILDYVLPFVR